MSPGSHSHPRTLGLSTCSRFGLIPYPAAYFYSFSWSSGTFSVSSYASPLPLRSLPSSAFHDYFVHLSKWDSSILTWTLYKNVSHIPWRVNYTIFHLLILNYLILVLLNYRLLVSNLQITICILKLLHKSEKWQEATTVVWS